MTNRALQMPPYVAELVKLPLVRLGLNLTDEQDDLITCPLTYENGTELSIAVLCVAQRGWFREKAALVVSFVELDGDRRAVRVHYRDSMRVPTGPGDLDFVVRFSAKIRAIAWSLAATTGMGECVDLPGRPEASGR